MDRKVHFHAACPFVQRVNPVYVSTHMTKSPMCSPSESASQARRLTTYHEMLGCDLKLIIPCSHGHDIKEEDLPKVPTFLVRISYYSV